MATEAQIAANQRNAQRSTGPTSPEGKLRSSRNALKHGLLAARTAVLSGESQEAYKAHIQAFINKFLPQDSVESSLVQRMADTDWRLLRIRSLEAATLDLQVDETSPVIDERYDALDEDSRLAYALQLLDPSQLAAYANLQRAEARLHRQYRQDYKFLTELRTQKSAEKKTMNLQNEAK